MRRIVVCADDFALSGPVTRGIVALARAGRLGAVGAMTAGAHWPDAWMNLGELPSQVPLGLHVNLVDGVGLADGERLGTAEGLAVRAFAGRLRVDVLVREIDAQWTAFERLAGRAPAFVDTHRHVHVLAPVRDALLQVVAARGARTPVRNLHPFVGPRRGRAKRRLLRLAGAPALAARLHAAGLAANTAIAGLQDFGAAGDVERAWLEMLDVLPDGAMVAVHPAIAADPSDPIGAFRVAEHAWLAGEAFARACAARGVRCVPLDAIREIGAAVA